MPQTLSTVDLDPCAGEEQPPVKAFNFTLADHGLTLLRSTCDTLQINLGLLCNQACRHCHLSAGPGRTENMDLQTVNQVIDYVRKCSFQTVDITGGAPELNPHLSTLIEGVSGLCGHILLRCNLSALTDGRRDYLFDLLPAFNVGIIVSLPSLNAGQTDAQRGQGVHAKSIAGLKRLNSLGYGRAGTNLELNIVSNPQGAYLPPSQSVTEKRFRKLLSDRWGITFNRLFTFANVPLGRYRKWLKQSGNFEAYMQRLISAFNPSALNGLMCRTLVSVAWDGFVFDCDFNSAKRVGIGGREIHISELDGPPAAGSSIATADHCYTCMAGSGFT